MVVGRTFRRTTEIIKIHDMIWLLQKGAKDKATLLNRKRQSLPHLGLDQPKHRRVRTTDGVQITMPHKKPLRLHPWPSYQ